MGMVWWMKSPTNRDDSHSSTRERRALQSYTFNHNFVQTALHHALHLPPSRSLRPHSFRLYVHFFGAVVHFELDMVYGESYLRRCAHLFAKELFVPICVAFYLMQFLLSWRKEQTQSTSSVVKLFSGFLHFARRLMFWIVDALTMIRYLTSSYLPFFLTVCWCCCAARCSHFDGDRAAMQTIRFATLFSIDAHRLKCSSMLVRDQINSF